MQENNIKATMEIIWHLTCGHCQYYWTYPTMQMQEKIDKRQLYCPLCGTKSAVYRENGIDHGEE